MSKKAIYTTKFQVSCRTLMVPLMGLVFWSLLLIPQQSQAQSLCSALFQEKYPPKSVTYFIDQVTLTENPTIPRFIDPHVERQMVDLWKGTRNVPRALRHALTPEMAVIDYPLLAADQGTVKMAEPGVFTSLRFNHQWQGKDMSTNIGIPIDAVMARTFEGTNQLIPSNAKGVFIFMHGGGTKTTGHHVAAALANYFNPYGIVVVSIDAPFHAYGPREDISPVEYYQYLRDFRHSYIPAGVPTFLGGHSMGGLHADNLMRLSDQEGMGLTDAFQGLVNLSGPMDAAPGEPLSVKSEIEDRLNSDPQLLELIPEDERDLNVSLLIAGKTSALGGLSAQTFMSFVDWARPSHNGADYLPTLAVMGARDGLMVGRESIFDEYLANLSNVTSLVMDERQSYTGQNVHVGHMVFDHYRPGTKELETFSVIKDFIGDQLGEPLVSQVHPLVADLPKTVGTLNNVIQSYFNNLAFREFAQTYRFLIKKGTERTQTLGEEMGALSKENKQLNYELKNLDRESNPERAQELQERIDANWALASEMREQLNLNYIPQDDPVIRERAEINTARRREIKATQQDHFKTKKEVMKQLNQARKERVTLEKELEILINSEIEHERVDTPTMRSARLNEEAALETMLALQIRMNEGNNELVSQNHEQGQYSVNPDPELIETYRDLDRAYADFIIAKNNHRRAIEEALFQGALGEEGQQKIVELWGSFEALEQNAPLAGSVISRVRVHRAEVEAIERAMALLNQENMRLEVEYVNELSPGFYEARMTTIAQELEQPFQQLVLNTGTIEKVWGEWVEIWRQRPPEEATSLY